MDGGIIIASRNSEVATIGQVVSARRPAASQPGVAVGVTAVAEGQGSWRPMSRIERRRDGHPARVTGNAWCNRRRYPIKRIHAKG